MSGPRALTLALPILMGCAALASDPGRLLNLSNRAFVGNGDERLIGSVRAVGEPGTQVEVLVVGRGPSLADADDLADYTGNVLADPRMTLVNLATREETTNDDFADWNDGEIESRFPGFITDPKESGAILMLDADQAYSAIVEGVGGATGLGQIEFYEVGGSGSITEARLWNLSNRALVDFDEERLIGSAMTTGDSPVEVLVVGRGPSLADALPDYTGNVLADPRMTLVNLATREETANDDFGDWNDGEIESRFPGFITDPKESGFIVQLPAEGSFSAILEGVGGTTGIGQIEFYELPPTMTDPDLVVSSPSVSDDSLGPAESFTFSINVHNRGEGESEPTTLRYYRSSNATITTSDTQVGTDAVGTLAASGSSSESIELTASSTPGTWYYGACVDVVAGETSATNNCSESVQVVVTMPPPPTRPDLTVGAPSVSDDSLDAGESFTLSATVSNTGDGESTATTLRYYRSSNATITTSDAQVGTDAVGTLAASGSSAESISLTAPSMPGTWYYGACVEAVAEESNTTNNCSESVLVDVKERQITSPGLDIDLVYVDPQPSAAIKAAINAAAGFWERAITNDLTDVDFSNNPQDDPCTDVAFDGFVDDVRVYIYFVDMDGSGGTTASAGICTQRSSSKTPVIGRIRFDSTDASRLSTTTVGHIAEHELAHVLGFGIRWDNLQNPSFQGGQAVDPPPDTHWPGTNAIAAFNAAGGSSYQGGKVPVENERGGSGSQDKHWRLSVMPGELMTYNLDGSALSAITLQSMADLGYTVDTSVADSYTVPSSSNNLLSFAAARVEQHHFHCEIDLLEVDYVPE